MDRLRALAPWQIALGAVIALVIVVVGGYFVVNIGTQSGEPVAPSAQIPTDLDAKPNQEITEKLGHFKPSREIQPAPHRTVDPDNPLVGPNPFQ